MSGPLVSVVVPVFDAARLVPEALDSIRAQGYEPLEIIAVDDGSTDDTAAVLAAQPDITVITQTNQGPAAARNRGIEAARGELVAFCDADDLWPADKLEIQVGRLSADPSLDLVLGRVQYVALEGGVVKDHPWEDTDRQVITNVQLGSGVYRRRCFDTIGLFDETLRYSEDQDWFLRAREHGLTMRILEDVTLVYRLHTRNMTRQRTPEELAIARVLKMSLDRRRAGGARPAHLGNWLDHDERRVGTTGPDGAGA